MASSKVFTLQNLIDITDTAETVGNVSGGVDAVAIKALKANSTTIYIGPSGVTASTGYPLEPGEGISANLASSSGIFMVGAAGDGVALFGTPQS